MLDLRLFWLGLPWRLGPGLGTFRTAIMPSSASGAISLSITAGLHAHTAL